MMNENLFFGVIADDDLHTEPADYETALASAKEAPSFAWNGIAFRRDAALVKIDLYSFETPLAGVSASVTDFTASEGSVLPSACADLRFVTPTLAHDCQRMIPDCLDSKGPVSIEARTVKTLFAVIDVPSDTEAADYHAVLTVTADGVKQDFSLSLRVLPYTLPAAHDNDYQLELWTYPYSAERYYSGKTTEEYFGEGIAKLPFQYLTGEADDAIRSQLALYAKAGGKAITVICVEDPWNTQTPDPYPSMVKWHCHEDGTFTFDYTDFDRYVSLNMEMGIDRQIKTFSLVPWEHRVTYALDDGTTRTEVLLPGSERWQEVWSAFLRDYMRHTLEKGWFDITYLAMDERQLPEVEALLALNDSIATEDGRHFKTSIAVYSFGVEPVFDRLDDLSLNLGMDPEKVAGIADHRRQNGKLTTLYTCGPSHSALCNPPYESEFSQLFTARCHTDGFLRWALDAFNVDPIASSAHRLFASGDLYLIYPSHPGTGRDAHSSHRFEKIRAGIRDVEKIRLLMKERPEYKDELQALVDSLDPKAGEKAELHRVMDAVYAIAQR